MVQHFPTRESAETAASEMAGWHIRIVQRQDLDRDDVYYVIECNGRRYLHTDGTVHEPEA
jgi:hypothetical protein